MGAKHASIHLRCEDSAPVVAGLQREWKKRRLPAKNEQAALEMLKTFATQNIAATQDAAEREKKTAILQWALGQMQRPSGAEDPILLVTQRHFVSLYWRGQIRCENMPQQLRLYALACGVPALGVGVYDDDNFLISAFCGGTAAPQSCAGEYLFDSDERTPVRAEELCRVADAPFLLAALQKTLACTTGAAMAQMFEQQTGLAIYLNAQQARAEGLHQLDGWQTVEGTPVTLFAR